MTNKTLKAIILQIKKYNLKDCFKNEQELKEWLSGLNDIQIDNFLKLDIDSTRVSNVSNVLIDKYMLSKEDYIKRIEAISKIQNADGYIHLLKSALVNKSFIDSKYYYEDIDMLSRAESVKCILNALESKDFNTSPYHQEDMKLIIEAKDVCKYEDACGDEFNRSFEVEEALTIVACNKDSINSPYHQEDMRLIAETGSKCLHINDSYYEIGLNNLAINKVSLKDKYHRENMKLLTEHPELDIMLYNMMTDEVIVKSKNYRMEIDTICSAKSLINALALYYYIFNPSEKYQEDCYNDEIFDTYRYNYIHKHMYTKTLHISDNAVYPANTYSNHREEDIRNRIKYNRLKELEEYKYLRSIEIIKKAPDDIVLHIVSLLMNLAFYLHSSYELDIELLLSIPNEHFNLLYECMNDSAFLTNPYHNYAVSLIAKSKNQTKVTLLTKIIFNNNKENILFDLDYVYNMDDSVLEKKIIKLKRILFSNTMSSEEHKRQLLNFDNEELTPEVFDSVSAFMNDILESNDNDELIVLTKNNDQVKNDNNSSIKKLVRKIFKHNK